MSFSLISQLGLHSGNLLRFAIGDGGLSIVDGTLEKADLHYLGKSNRARAFADSYSKVCGNELILSLIANTKGQKIVHRNEKIP